MGAATEVAEAAAKGSAKVTAEAAAKESALAIIKKGGTLKEAYAAAMEQAGVHGQTLDMNVLRAQMVRHKMLKDQAAEAAKKAKAETPPPAEPKIDASKLDYEDLAAELKALKPGESGSYRLPNVGADVHVTRHAIHPSNAGAATQEAINRYAQEKAAGQYRVVINQNGTLSRIIGADSVDYTARPGQVVLQRGIGADEWTPLSHGADIHPSHIKGIIARAATGLAALVAAGTAGAADADMENAYIKAFGNGAN